MMRTFLIDPDMMDRAEVEKLVVILLHDCLEIGDQIW